MVQSPHEEFLRWYEPVHDRFVRYCGSRALGLMETEDLVQEAVLHALQAFYRIEDKQRLLGYLIGVVNNLVKQARRRQKFVGAWEEKTLSKLESRTGDPETALDIQYLLKAIQQLPRQQREALVLFEISGFSIREISEIQVCSEGAVKTRLSRSRQRLRELLSEDGRPMPLSKRLAIYASLL
ncbi:MAG: RNA polymerase sigma factor [Lewinellaceae bacterium]|nr:RNA polymerase sigma factor [Saprospiraceae bacterium]MCB9341896.1 RNA polymerase sigma factor [Lewinellaceae bacterium]